LEWRGVLDQKKWTRLIAWWQANLSTQGEKMSLTPELLADAKLAREKHPHKIAEYSIASYRVGQWAAHHLGDDD